MAEALHEAIITCCAIKGFVLIAHVICPDHVHMMVWQCESARVGHREAGSRLPLKRKYRWREEPALGHGNNYNLRWLFPESQRTFSNVRKEGTISDLMQSIKGGFSRLIHRGRLWQPHFNSRIIGSEQHYLNALQYIQDNCQKHGWPDKYGRPPHVFINDKLFD